MPWTIEVSGNVYQYTDMILYTKYYHDYGKYAVETNKFSTFAFLQYKCNLKKTTLFKHVFNKKYSLSIFKKISFARTRNLC